MLLGVKWIPEIIYTQNKNILFENCDTFFFVDLAELEIVILF